MTTGTIVCGVCGTVNVGVFARCIACGQELGGAVAESSDEPDTESRESPDLPLQQENDVTGPVALGGPPTPSSVRARSQQARDVSEELDSAAFRQTVIEIPKSVEVVPAPVAPRPTPVAARPAPAFVAPVVPARAAPVVVVAPAAAPPTETAPVVVLPPSPPPAEAAPRAKSPAPAHAAPPPPPVPSTMAAPPPQFPAPSTPAPRLRFVARLLLPEGDRRSVELGKRPVALGSGLDELGLSGDPRAGAAEALLTVVDGKLYVEPAPSSQNVYLRIDREIKLVDGDVVLMGDVAALFTQVDPGGPVDGARQVLGGSANAACGRLAFLRRDGSPGPVHDLPAGKTVIGRTDGHLNFPNDSRLSRRHALYFASDQGVTVEDMDSRNGTYLRVRARQELEPEDALRVGSAGVQIRVK